MFWKNKKDVILDCYTSNPFAYNLARINYGYHFIPEWWKRTPKKVQITELEQKRKKEEDTIRKCPGIVTYYKTGIVIPMWCELNMVLCRKDENELFKGKSSNDSLQVRFHGPEQFIEFAKEDGHNLKLVSPWHIRCKEPILFTMSQPTWSQRDTMEHLHLLPGVLDFKTQMSTNLNYFVVRKDHRVELNIDPLTPMAILHPHTDRKIVLKHHYVHDNDIFQKVMRAGFSMFNMDAHGNRFKGQTKKEIRLIQRVDEMNKDEWKF